MYLFVLTGESPPDDDRGTRESDERESGDN